MENNQVSQTIFEHMSNWASEHAAEKAISLKQAAAAVDRCELCSLPLPGKGKALGHPLSHNAAWILKSHRSTIQGEKAQLRSITKDHVFCVLIFQPWCGNNSLLFLASCFCWSITYYWIMIGGVHIFYIYEAAVTIIGDPGEANRITPNLPIHRLPETTLTHTYM